MYIAFKFKYVHNNGLFVRLLKRIKEISPLELKLYKEQGFYIIEASGNQDELEVLAELVSKIIPQSLFLVEHRIEEIRQSDESQALVEENSVYSVPYCPQCQESIMKTLDPFVPCNVCGFSDISISLDDLVPFEKTEKNLFESLADELINKGSLSLLTYNGSRTFSLLDTKEDEDSGILICNPSELSSYFVITQAELDTLMMVEKPSLRLKPKIKFRAEYALERPFYPAFLADDKITLALSISLSRKGVFALYCDHVTSLRTASALKEHVIIDIGRDMLSWRVPQTMKQPSRADFNGFTALANSEGLLLDRMFEPSEPCIRFVAKDEDKGAYKGISFEPSHAALKCVALEHDLDQKPLCGIYLSRQRSSQICSFSSKIGYTSLAEFSYEVPNSPILMLESISQMDEEGKRLVANYKKVYPTLYEGLAKVGFTSNEKASMLSRLWAMAAIIIGLCEKTDIQTACEELEARALEFNGKSGPRIDYKVMKSDGAYQVDPRLAIRSAMSFKLAGVDEFLLSFGFIDSLADFIAEQAELADANIAIEGVSLTGNLFENRQLLMRTYNALSPNYKIYRNRRLALDGANISLGAITLGSE